MLLLSRFSHDQLCEHRWQPTRLPRPWDSPGKNTGVSCHVLLQCMKVKSEREVAQLCPTLSDPLDCSLPGSSIHGIFQARVLEWGAIAFSAKAFYLPAILVSETSNKGHMDDTHYKKCVLVFPPVIWQQKNQVTNQHSLCKTAETYKWPSLNFLQVSNFSHKGEMRLFLVSRSFQYPVGK